MRQKNRFLNALVIYVIVAAVLITGASLLKNTDSFVDGSPAFGNKGSEAALVTIEGVIMSSGGEPSMFGGMSAASSMRLVKEIKELSDDPSVKGIIVRIDSPGGSAAASDEIWNALMAVPDKIPVVVSMGDVAASGGYYIASAGDFIYANPATLTGSIGVIFDTMDLSGLFDKLGIASNTLHAGEFKDIGSMSRPMTDSERKMMQAMLDQIHEQFIERVAAGRKAAGSKMEVDDVRKLATGMIYTGEQAKGNGLVDEIGGFEDAFTKLEDLCHEKLTLREPPPPNFWEMLMRGGISSNIPPVRYTDALSAFASMLFLNPLAANLSVR
jgi:protease-4